MTAKYGERAECLGWNPQSGTLVPKNGQVLNDPTRPATPSPSANTASLRVPEFGQSPTDEHLCASLKCDVKSQLPVQAASLAARLKPGLNVLQFLASR